MRRTLKISKIGMGVSAAAFLLALIVIIIAGFEWPQITTACSLFAVFCANLTIYLSAKKKTEGDEKD